MEPTPATPDHSDPLPPRAPRPALRTFITLALLVAVWVGLWLLLVFFGGPLGPDN